MSFACKQFGIECKVFMVKVSYHQKPYRRSMMHMWGGKVVASPSNETAIGTRDPGRRSGFARQPGHRHQRSGGSGRPERRYATTRSAAC